MEAGEQVLVQEWMTADPVTVTPQTSVLNARRLLRAHAVRHLPVVDGDRVVGMVSDRDLLVGDSQVVQALSALQSDLLGGRYRRVDTVMTVPVRAVRADDPVRVAAERMQRWRLDGLPVTDEGRLVGIITTTDCLHALLVLLDRDARGVQREPGVLAGDPDWYKMTPMPPGDDRPGRPVAPAAPAVTHPAPASAEAPSPATLATTHA